MKKIVYVILHYITIDDTKKCVQSIIDKCNENFEIVIVDNNSPNNTGDVLKEEYRENEKVHVILSDKNLGFANGNNLGFKYAKENLNPEFIVMCNNDVYMIQNDFCEKIIEEYNRSKFAILGPKILLNNNKICDYEDKMLSLKQLKRKMISTKIYYYLNKLHLRYVYAIFSKIFKLFNRRKKIVDTSIRKEDVVIHGCCIIFSQEYIEKFDGIDNRTFLYYEEPLLYLRVKRNGMKSVYNPDIKIFHNEGIATTKTQKNKRKKFDFVLKNELESINILISEYEDITEKI